MKMLKLVFKLRYKLFIFLLLISVFSLPAQIKADDHTNARGKGMSNASMVSSFGIDAFSINPANYYINKYDVNNKNNNKTSITKRNKPQFEISIFSVGGAMGSDASFDFYKRYKDFISLTKENFVNTLTDINKLQDFSENILPEEKTNVDFDFEIKWLSFNVTFPKFGALNFTVSDKVALATSIPGKGQTLPNTYTISYNPSNGLGNLSNVEFHQQEANSWWLRKYSLGASKVFEFKNGDIKSFSIGFAGSLVHGFGDIDAQKSDFYISTYGIGYNPQTGYVHIDSVAGSKNFNTRASLTDFFNDFYDGSITHFNLFPKPAGIGYSFDFGLSMQIGDYVRIAGSVTDLGKVKWNYNTFSNFDRSSFLYRNFDVNRSDPTYNSFVNDVEGKDTRDTSGSYETNMPTKFRAGIMVQPSDKYLIELDWLKGNNNMPGNSTDHIVSLGSEYNPVEFLSLRAGTSFGGVAKFLIGLGAGLKFPNFTVDIAANGINQMITKSKFSFAVATKILF